MYGSIGEPNRTFLVGMSGSGKTSWIKNEVAQHKRVLVWDWRREYGFPPVKLEELPAMFQESEFHRSYQPNPLGELNTQFQALALCLLLLSGSRSFTFVVDEAYLVCPNYQEGGLGKLLRLSRTNDIELILSSQRPTLVPGVFVSESKRLIVFHLHKIEDLRWLRNYVDADTLRQVPRLRTFEFLEVPLTL